MEDLIGLDMDSPTSGPSTAPPAKATDSLLDLDMDTLYSPTPVPATVPTPIVDVKEAAYAWKACLIASINETKFPLVPVMDGPFAEGVSDEFEEMLKAKQNGKHDIINPFLRPTGPTHEHIALIQGLHDQGQPLDHIAHYLVVTFPNLMRGWKDGTEHDRRLQVHGLVHIWVSMWAPRFAKDGSILWNEGDGDKAVGGWKDREVNWDGKSKVEAKPTLKLNVPGWLKKEAEKW